jgi:hypothetical protein
MERAGLSLHIYRFILEAQREADSVVEKGNKAVIPRAPRDLWFQERVLMVLGIDHFVLEKLSQRFENFLGSLTSRLCQFAERQPFASGLQS